jgi:hypothetical protein
MLSSNGNPSIEGIKLVHPTLECACDDLLRGAAKLVMNDGRRDEDDVKLTLYTR